jgi:hypothetical protein
MVQDDDKVVGQFVRESSSRMLLDDVTTFEKGQRYRCLCM